MTAGELRQASGEMRRLAEAAAPSPWTSGLMGVWSESEDERGGCYIATSVHEHNPCKEDIIDSGNRMHIAAWHPAVALAVAEQLDLAAEWLEDCADSNPRWVTKAVATARAFLGTTP